ncbi:MAG: hypothetical protein AB7E77_05620 [Desulfobulbus sp.]
MEKSLVEKRDGLKQTNVEEKEPFDKHLSKRLQEENSLQSGPCPDKREKKDAKTAQDS